MNAARSARADARAAALRGLCGGAVHLPGDPHYDVARRPWNTAVDRRPAAVAYPASAEEAAEVVRAAVAAGLRVAPMGTGHNAGPLAPLDDVVLVRTAAMTGVRVDPVAGSARVAAGVIWWDAIVAAGRHRLAALHPTSPDVGVVGYSLGGGVGWYARRLGLQADAVTAVELVLADGSRTRADAEHHPELFWAVRGGAGNYGLVTALEFGLHDVPVSYAGSLAWDVRDAERVLTRWAAWAPTADPAVTTALRLLRVPHDAPVPEEFRSRHVVVVDGAVALAGRRTPGPDEAAAERLIAPLRDLGPDLDTFRRLPAPGLARLHLDPEGGLPVASRSALLGDLPPAAVTALLDVAGPDAPTSLFLPAELRQLGGALAAPRPGAGPMSHFEGEFLLFSGSLATGHGSAAAAGADAERVAAALRPWARSRRYLSYTEQGVDTATGFPRPAWARLQAVRAAVDPHGVFVANHQVPLPAAATTVPPPR